MSLSFTLFSSTGDRLPQWEARCGLGRKRHERLLYRRAFFSGQLQLAWDSASLTGANRVGGIPPWALSESHPASPLVVFVGQEGRPIRRSKPTGRHPFLRDGHYWHCKGWAPSTTTVSKGWLGQTGDLVVPSLDHLAERNPDGLTNARRIAPVIPRMLV